MTDNSFTVEELREKAQGYSLRGDDRTAAMLNAYADMLKRPAYSANPHTLADSFTLPDAERVHIGQQVAARVDAMMDRPADSGRVGDGRATFEAWVSKRHGAPLGRWADSGKYQYDNTNAWWECWQAALAAQGQREENHKHEREMLEVIDERDRREEIIDCLCDAVLGQGRPEWSSAYGYDDALLEVQEAMFAPPASPAGVPDAKTEMDYEYDGEEDLIDPYWGGHMDGWNDCRKAMISAAPSAPEGNGGAE